MSAVLPEPLLPMEALSVAELPAGEQWQYEPKWDGFRCLAFRDGDELRLQSKANKPLARYFPELAESLRLLKARKFVLDGEIVIQRDGRVSFDDLLLRIHPAASRIRKLAAERPAMLVAFDLLADERGRSLVDLPLADRRARLEKFSAKYFAATPAVRLSPATTDLDEARRWFDEVGGDLDGIIAKRRDEPYRSGERAGMVKIKQHRSADCVVGGFRYASNEPVVGSLLLGLYDEEGALNHVGFTSGLRAAERTDLTKKLKKLVAPPGFTGNRPGGPSRWSTERSTEWEPLRPELVVEVQYDHFSGGRFRHGTKLLRWRPDKAPAQCRYDQIVVGNRAPELLH